MLRKEAFLFFEYLPHVTKSTRTHILTVTTMSLPVHVGSI